MLVLETIFKIVVVVIGVNAEKSAFIPSARQVVYYLRIFAAVAESIASDAKGCGGMGRVILPLYYLDWFVLCLK